MDGLEMINRYFKSRVIWIHLLMVALTIAGSGGVVWATTSANIEKNSADIVEIKKNRSDDMIEFKKTRDNGIEFQLGTTRALARIEQKVDDLRKR